MRPPAVLSPEAHCRSCRRPTRWRWYGGEETRKRIDYWRCLECGWLRMQMADVPDSEGLCETVLDEYVRSHRGDERLDRGNALGFLREQLWVIYLAWSPDGLTFLSYGTGLLRRRFNDYFRKEIGRGAPKPLAVADSIGALGQPGETTDETLDYLVRRTPDRRARRDGLDRESEDGGRTGGGRLGLLVGSSPLDGREDRAPDLSGTLRRRRSDLAREDARMGLGETA